MTSNEVLAGPAPGTGDDGKAISPAPTGPRRASLVTGNLRHFERVPELTVENWLPG